MQFRGNGEDVAVAIRVLGRMNHPSGSAGPAEDEWIAHRAWEYAVTSAGSASPFPTAAAPPSRPCRRHRPGKSRGRRATAPTKGYGERLKVLPADVERAAMDAAAARLFDDPPATCRRWLYGWWYQPTTTTAQVSA